MTHVHFVGFRGEEFWSAFKVWGRPTFIHRFWDVRAWQEAQSEDVVVFARQKDWNRIDNPTPWTFDDSAVM